MAQPLEETLFRIALAPRDAPLDGLLRERIEAADGADFERALALLTPHKLYPLIAYQLAAFGLFDRIPASARDTLSEAQRATRLSNMAITLCAASLFRAAAQRGERPVVMKGVLFANDLYPDVSTRPMGDMDVVAAPGRHDALLSLLSSLGFRRAAEQPQDDAVVMELPNGVSCDAHKQLAMFGASSWESLTRETELLRLKGVPVYVLEPSAMLAHLTVHMGGHLDEVGPVLLWLMDIALVLRRDGQQIDPRRVSRYVDDPMHWLALLRVLGMLARMGESLPPAWAELVGRVPALSFDAVLRQRRTVPWGLPSPKGFARVLAHTLKLRDYRPKRIPVTRDDLLLCPLDVVTTRVLARLAPRPG